MRPLPYKPLRFYLGGPAYRRQFDLVHLEYAVSFVSLLRQRGHGLVAMDYEHTSILPEGRARWLHRATLTNADIAVGVDADTGVAGDGLLHAAELFHATGAALCGVVVPQRDGRVNAWEAPGQRISAIEASKLVEAHAVGSALCLYNLAWYRDAARSDTESEAAESDLASIATSYAMVSNREGHFVGEDYWHCEWVRRRGGRILATSLPGVRHAGGF